MAASFERTCQVRNRVRQSRTLGSYSVNGSARGAPGNRRSYRDNPHVRFAERRLETEWV